MILAQMIASDEDALICDLCETYHIFDYKALPVRLLATLSSGLRPDSRSMMSLAGVSATQQEILLAGVADRVGNIAWMLTADGQKGRNYPPQIMDILLNSDQKSEDKKAGPVQTFDSPEEFEAAMAAAKGGGYGN